MKIGTSKKVILLFILLVIILGVALGFYSLKHQRETILFEFDERGKVLLSALAVSSEYPVLIGNEKALDKIGKGILEQSDVVFCEIRNIEGEILYKGGSKKAKYCREYTFPILTEVDTESTGEELILGFKEKETKEIGKIYLVLSISSLLKKLNKMKKAMGVLVILGIVSASILITALVRLILSKPINDLIRGIERISGGDLKYKVPIKSNDEIGELAVSFNKMAEALSNTLVSKDYVDNIISSMIFSLIVTDAEGKIKTVNPATLDLLGYREDEIIGQSVDTVFKEEKKEILSWDETPRLEGKVFRNLIKNRVVNYFEMNYLTKNRQEIPVILSCSIIRDREGKIVNIIFVARDITKLKHAEEALRNSEEKYRSLSNQLPIGIYRTTKEGKILHANPALASILEYENVEELTKIKAANVYGDPIERTKQLKQWKTSKGVVCNEIKLRTKKDKHIWVRDTGRVILDKNGEIDYIDGAIENITERRKAEEKIKRSLREKEVLLQEIHHRVKNNMQIISSLHKLQSKQIKDKQALEIFKSTQNRVKSMALIHERLYQSKDFARVDLADYVRSLTSNLFSSYGISRAAIKLNIDIKDVSLDINTAIPCGLIINELVSNSLKHGFPDGEKGEINIIMHPSNENKIALIVSDNGIGIPEEVDFRNTESLGLHLVTILAENQLHGEIKLDRTKGTRFQIRLNADNKGRNDLSC